MSIKNKVKNIVSYTLFLLPLILFSNSNYYQSDPFYLLNYERHSFSSAENLNVFDLRPEILFSSKRNSFMSFKSFFFYSDNAPNLENTSELWVGKGSSFFNSIHFNFSNNFLFLSVEPYIHISQNKSHKSQFTRNADEKYRVLNDGTPFSKSPYYSFRFRETQVYLQKAGLGIGFSNAGNWWGPGIHNSLIMTNNTSGFPHIVLGTLSELKWKSYGFNIKYYFSRLDRNESKPYYTSLLGQVKLYSKPVISVGIIRNFLSGGNISNETVSIKDAMLLPFKSLFKSTLVIENDFTDPSDDIDEILTGFISILFPESKLKLFLEYGVNDHRWDWHDLRAYPDHSAAINIGIRKFEIFNNPDFVFGLEYYNNIIGRIYNSPSPSWYGKEYFQYSTYDGRRFTSHAGSNADDLILFFGRQKKGSSTIVSFNYERHGLEKSLKTGEELGRLPEVKFELKIDYRREFRSGKIYFLYEYEFLENLGFEYKRVDVGLFEKNIPKRICNTLSVGYEVQIKTFPW